jgi:hypothetical protein
MDKAPSMQLPEKLGQPRDWQAELVFAADHAPLLDPMTPEGVAVTLEPEEGVSYDDSIRDLPDTAVVTFGDGPIHAPHIVATNSPEEYLALVRHAHGLSPSERGEPFWEQRAEEVYDHEMQHAAEATRRSPNVTVWYTVGIYKKELPDGEFEYSMTPSVVVVGTLRKIDYALIIGAPSSESKGHPAALQFFGYESAEQARARYALLGSQPQTRLIKP